MNASARRYGAGSRQALALHCTLAHSGAWRGLGQAIGDQLSLRAIDFPGHGTSPDWDQSHDFTDVAVACAKPYLTAPMDVIGHSYGAVVALLLAVSCPEMVRSLTLIEPVFFAVAQQDAPDALARHAHEVAPYQSAMDEGDWAEAARLFNRLWGNGTKWADIPARTQLYMTDRIHIIPAQASAIFDDSYGLLTRGRLARANMPTLLIHGGQSPEIAGSIVGSLARRMTNARHVKIAGAGHMSPLTHPEHVGNEIRSFLEMA